MFATLDVVRSLLMIFYTKAMLNHCCSLANKEIATKAGTIFVLISSHYSFHSINMANKSHNPALSPVHMRWFTHGVQIIHICIICTRVYFWACERNCICVKVNLHMCKSTPRVNIRLLRPGVYLHLHICIFCMYFWSCERAANIHPYANVSFLLILSKIGIKNKIFLC